MHSVQFGCNQPATNDSVLSDSSGKSSAPSCPFCLPSWSENRSDQHRKSVPCDLHPDAEQDEGNHSQDAMCSSRRNDPGDLGSIRVTEIDKHAENNHGKKYTDMCLNISR
jgi:hypothetical protein